MMFFNENSIRSSCLVFDVERVCLYLKRLRSCQDTREYTRGLEVRFKTNYKKIEVHAKMSGLINENTFAPSYFGHCVKSAVIVLVPGYFESTYYRSKTTHDFTQ